jgi:hypothetical protein
MRIASATLLATALTAVGVAATAGPAAATGPAIWTVPLDRVTNDDVNVTTTGGLTISNNRVGPASARNTTGTGYLVTATHRFATPVNRYRAELAATVPPGASVTVEVRSATTGGGWTEWTPTPATLTSTATEAQVRVTLTGDGSARPVVRRVTLLADQADAALAPLATTAGTYRVYATREGLVGGTTANGHVITSRDHFVALPSGRSLASRNTGTYTVKACANSRCEWAPVWDVGPWNTKDDYWNPSSTRQMWTDLAQGTPEAQAAYQSGYNGGRDETGRTVTNPAGIDLADGVFWDGLKMVDNGWVTVTYLWTGTGITGTVGTAGSPLTVRSGPHTSSTAIGYAANYARVTITCQTTGDSVTGTYGTTTLWDQISTGFYISDAYVYTGSDGQVAPNC